MRSLKFTVYGHKQANKHTHVLPQCSPASVGLAQAHPNKLAFSLYQWTLREPAPLSTGISNTTHLLLWDGEKEVDSRQELNLQSPCLSYQCSDHQATTTGQLPALIVFSIYPWWREFSIPNRICTAHAEGVTEFWQHWLGGWQSSDSICSGAGGVLTALVEGLAEFWQHWLRGGQSSDSTCSGADRVLTALAQELTEFWQHMLRGWQSSGLTIKVCWPWKSRLEYHVKMLHITEPKYQSDL